MLFRSHCFKHIIAGDCIHIRDYLCFTVFLSISDDLIGKYYGASAQKAGRFTSRAKAVVLTQEELDDDALIALIEDNPTYNRDPKIVARARSKVAGEDIQVSAPTTAKQPANQPRQDSQRGGKQVISFR